MKQAGVRPPQQTVRTVRVHSIRQGRAHAHTVCAIQVLQRPTSSTICACAMRAPDVIYPCNGRSICSHPNNLRRRQLCYCYNVITKIKMHELQRRFSRHHRQPTKQFTHGEVKRTNTSEYTRRTTVYTSIYHHTLVEHGRVRSKLDRNKQTNCRIAPSPVPSRMRADNN